MTYVPLWAPLRQLCIAFVVMFGCGFLLALPADAQETSGYTSFVKSQYYLGNQGTPPTLVAFAANPQHYLRPGAYEPLKQGFATALGRSLSDAQFQTLLGSDQVRLVPCTGQIDTAGIRAGSIGWSMRNCYHNQDQEEQLIQLNVNSIWVTVASQGCFNLVRVSTPPVQTQTQAPQWWSTTNAPPRLHTVPPLDVCGCVWLPGATYYQPGTRFAPSLGMTTNGESQ